MEEIQVYVTQTNNHAHITFFNRTEVCFILTGVFQEILQWGLNSGQNISTHLFKLTPYARENKFYSEIEKIREDIKNGP